MTRSGASDPGASAADYYELRRRRELIRIELEQLRLQREKGELVEAKVVHAAEFALGRRLRSRLLSIAGRLGPVLAGVSDPVQCVRLLDEAIHAACDELATRPRR